MKTGDPEDRTWGQWTRIEHHEKKLQDIANSYRKYNIHSSHRSFREGQREEKYNQREKKFPTP